MLDLHRLRLLTEFAARGSIAGTAAVLAMLPRAANSWSKRSLCRSSIRKS